MAADEDAIRKRAYEIWEREGRPHGRDLEHWDEAIRELTATNGASEPRAKLPRAPRRPPPKPVETMVAEAKIAAPPPAAKRRRVLSSVK